MYGNPADGDGEEREQEADDDGNHEEEVFDQRADELAPTASVRQQWWQYHSGPLVIEGCVDGWEMVREIAGGIMQPFSSKKRRSKVDSKHTVVTMGASYRYEREQRSNRVQHQVDSL